MNLGVVSRVMSDLKGLFQLMDGFLILTLCKKDGTTVHVPYKVSRIEVDDALEFTKSLVVLLLLLICIPKLVAVDKRIWVELGCLPYRHLWPDPVDLPPHKLPQAQPRLVGIGR